MLSWFYFDSNDQYISQKKPLYDKWCTLHETPECLEAPPTSVYCYLLVTTLVSFRFSHEVLDASTWSLLMIWSLALCLDLLDCWLGNILFHWCVHDLCAFLLASLTQLRESVFNPLEWFSLVLFTSLVVWWLLVWLPRSLNSVIIISAEIWLQNKVQSWVISWPSSHCVKSGLVFIWQLLPQRQNALC